MTWEFLEVSLRISGAHTFECLWGALGLTLWGAYGAQVLRTPLKFQAPIHRCDEFFLGYLLSLGIPVRVS